VQSADPFWLPAYYIGQLPGLSFMRTWARFGIITILFVALLAGLATTLLVRRFPRWPVAPALCALLLLDLLPGTVETLPLTPRPVDHWLAQQPGDFAVAHLPAGNSNVNYQAMFGSLFHARHLPAYNHPQHMPPAYRDFARRAQDFPAASSVAALRQMELRYLLLERAAFDGQDAPAWSMIEEQVTQSPAMAIVADLDSVVVVALR
jgi:hypothetical protein